MTKHRFRPHRSLSFPPGIMNAAITSRNTVMALCTPSTVVFRSLLMSLIITFMFEPAKLQMNWASASGTSILRRAGAGREDVLASAIRGVFRGVVRRHPRVVQLPVEAHGRGDEREVR